MSVSETNREKTEAMIIGFLKLMEERKLEEASKQMASHAIIIFPGGKQFASQQEMVEASRGRYQWVKKTFDRIDVLDEGAVVYVMGTLYGVNKHGVEFSNIRYIDRFEVENGLITRQEVWNDLAESNVLNCKT